jgi:hypothetical protein
MLVPPWREDLEGQQESAQVHSVLFLEHGAEDHRERLEPVEAGALMLQNAIGQLRRSDGLQVGSLFEVLTQLASQVPSYRLWFTPACGFLAGLERLHKTEKGGKNDEDRFL